MGYLRIKNAIAEIRDQNTTHFVVGLTGCELIGRQIITTADEELPHALMDIMNSELFFVNGNQTPATGQCPMYVVDHFGRVPGRLTRKNTQSLSELLLG